MNPPGQAPLVELARKCQRELDVLAARYADRAPHAFHVHRVQFAAWLEHWYVFEADRVDMALDYRVRNKLEVRGVLFTRLESMMLGIRSYRRKLRKELKVVGAVEALEAAVAAMGADEDGKDGGSGGGGTGWYSSELSEERKGEVEQDGESSQEESESESDEEEDIDAEFAEAPRHRQSEDPFTNALRLCRYELWHLIRNLDWATDLLAHSSMYAPSVLLQDHPDYSVRDEWDRNVNEEFQVVVRSALRHRCDVYNKVLNARLGTMVVTRRRALTYHSRFQDDSPMHVLRQNMNPATQHVLTDLEPYMCIFDTCTAEINTFRTPQQWLYHMETSHSSSTWTCRVPRCRGRTFYRQVAFEQDGINAHGYTSADLQTISHESRRPHPAIFRRCPFCGPRPGEDPPRNDDAYPGNVAASHAAHRLYNHVARHLEEFALLAIPYTPREPVVPPLEEDRGDSGYSRHILPIPRVADHGNWEWTFAENLPAYKYRRDVFPGSSRSIKPPTPPTSPCNPHRHHHEPHTQPPRTPPPPPPPPPPPNQTLPIRSKPNPTPKEPPSPAPATNNNCHQPPTPPFPVPTTHATQRIPNTTLQPETMPEGWSSNPERLTQFTDPRRRRVGAGPRVWAGESPGHHANDARDGRGDGVFV
ncbi:hypothetical protein BO99DRAFT_459997 [Aspergillus violaceofuscus CBS 115571]|uniref:C2H2-type domain-containing protein n=1 Tax=Aspergillus violaceofuscus (strain CBS 115571) TaxID=1450538 RepID=A0A2V5HH72_ASPV1|nr:hypothetical protein BO99DRAFT_459997 [Aspergillus violaceofuscus CBS 115571]